MAPPSLRSTPLGRRNVNVLAVSELQVRDDDDGANNFVKHLTTLTTVSGPGAIVSCSQQSRIHILQLELLETVSTQVSNYNIGDIWYAFVICRILSNELLGKL